MAWLVVDPALRHIRIVGYEHQIAPMTTRSRCRSRAAAKASSPAGLQEGDVEDDRTRAGGDEPVDHVSIYFAIPWPLLLHEPQGRGGLQIFIPERVQLLRSVVDREVEDLWMRG
jgi:hypothetical protein